jgi:hypothetical protein
MKPITIVIKGSFWDSQIYASELMLLGDEGSIARINWSDAIDEFAGQHRDLQTAMRVAFSDSDWLYNPQTKRLLDDPKIGIEVKSQLADLAKLPSREIKQSDWQKFWTTEDSPFSNLPSDTDIYKNKIYAASDEGLFSVPRTGSKLLNKIEKHHDASYLQVRASDGYKAVAAAAGGDGLFEFSIGGEEGDLERGAKLLSQRPCIACDWAFQSVVAWGAGSAYFANFTAEKDRRSSKVSRAAGDVFEFENLFTNLRSITPALSSATGDTNFAWGSREKLYRAAHGAIEVSDYFGNRWVKKPAIKMAAEALQSRPFTWRGTIPTQIEPKNIIATGTAPFGAVIEEDNQLTVIRSDGVVHTFPGELVHWRVFPRSTHYSNQLHLIYEDRLEIVSFVHDYFQDQTEKLAGFAK